MTKKERMERNIGLTFDFVNMLIDKPELADSFPDHFKVEFIEKDFPKNEPRQDETDPALKRKYVRVRNNFELTK
jgi:hypothetical protein